MKALLDFLDRLKEVKIYHTLLYDRPRMVTVLVTVPGERWEVEFGEDGEVDVEVFKSGGDIFHGEKIDDLFERFSD